MAFITPVVEHWLERERPQWVHAMKDRSDDPSHHEQTLLPRSYISLCDCQESTVCIYECVYVFMCVCMYVCMYVLMHDYIYVLFLCRV